MKKEYLDVVRLLVRVAPAVFSIPGFALKGGTAINLFVRNLRGMAERATSMGLQTHIPTHQEGDEVRILIRQGRLDL